MNEDLQNKINKGKSDEAVRKLMELGEIVVAIKQILIDVDNDAVYVNIYPEIEDKVQAKFDKVYNYFYDIRVIDLLGIYRNVFTQHQQKEYGFEQSLDFIADLTSKFVPEPE